MNNKLLIKTVLIILLVGCVFKMPYGYYTFLRIVGFVGFGILAFYEREKNNYLLMILSIGASLLLNPIIKIHFVRTLWNKIDLVLAILVTIWLFSDIINDRNTIAEKSPK